MKIGIYTPYLSTLSGGEKYMLTIATCLAMHHNVSIFWNPSQEEELRQRAKEKLAIDLSTIYFTKNIFSPNYSLLSRLRASKKYDRIIVLSDGSIPSVWCKLIIHYQFPVEWVNADSLKVKLKSRFIYKIICNSLFTKRYIDRKFRVSGILLYPPVDLSAVRKEKKENIILHVGRFGKNEEGKNYKKQDVMIEAFKALCKKGLKNWKFVIVIGVTEEDMQKIKELKNLTKGYPVEIVENPNNSSLWVLYNKAKIYWHASGYGEDEKKHPERLEHFGISTVEAMGSGAVPVVISAGGQKEIVNDGENGYLWESLGELEEKTMYLVKNADKMNELSRNAKKKAEQFSLKFFCKEINQIIR